MHLSMCLGLTPNLSLRATPRYAVLARTLARGTESDTMYINTCMHQCASNQFSDSNDSTTSFQKEKRFVRWKKSSRTIYLCAPHYGTNLAVTSIKRCIHQYASTSPFDRIHQIYVCVYARVPLTIRVILTIWAVEGAHGAHLFPVRSPHDT